ncbi:MAG: hypothetical protein KIT72_03640 [Polyangiaceae bacterium]|nr:hypothetical protein [Polyangiaceae bacterium]MCW5789494.1 hypothetical protein [Polyangiaceae bacterium]
MASDDKKTPPDLDADGDEERGAEPSQPKSRGAKERPARASEPDEEAEGGADEAEEDGDDAPSASKRRGSAASEDEDEDEAPRASKRRATSEDEDDDGEDEDGEEAAPPRKRSARQVVEARSKKRAARRDLEAKDGERPRRKRTRAGVKKKRRQEHVPATEAELNTPDRATTYMLASVVAATLILWAFARTACNFAPPEPDRHRVAEADVIAKEPRGAGVEYELRLRERHFDIAARLATGSAAEAASKAKEACGASCTPLERGAVLCQGTILSRDATSASLRVRCEQDGKEDFHQLALTREGTLWRVTSREATTAPSAAPAPAPPAADAGAPDAAP